MSEGEAVGHTEEGRRRIKALRVRQWMPEWDRVAYSAHDLRRRPEPHFYVTAMSATDLKALAGIQRRSADSARLRSEDLGIQRRHDPERSAEIREYVQFGYPWSELTKAQRSSGSFDDLRKPGWLPTAIVANILVAGDGRGGTSVAEHDLVGLDEDVDGTFSIVLPKAFAAPTWRPEAAYPIEIIDGQHRLWAFQPTDDVKEYDLPVVLFHGLDISWQAYLFWTINIRPKRINASLAFDLYPLLRGEDWLEKFSGHSIYRETRAQELVEALWAYPRSPWYQRINMLGEPGRGDVRQAAWVRSLVATFVKRWEGTGRSMGGLFGAPAGSHDIVLPWSGAQQAGLLIFLWQTLAAAVRTADSEWAESLRSAGRRPAEGGDPAFYGADSLLNTDPGVRGVLHVTNDLLWLLADDLALGEWSAISPGSPTEFAAVDDAIASLAGDRIGNFIGSVTTNLAMFDWRSSSAPGLSEAQRTQRLAIRGSGGYRELRRLLLLHLGRSADRVVARMAEQARAIAGL